MLLGDPLRLGQVLSNLVSNALKFSTGGNVVVSVKTVRLELGEIKLHFSVRDQGIGISDEQMAGLFQPFMQADTSTTRRFGGTGLGLAISRRLVELMRGEIWAESKLGSGSTFHFTVKLQTSGKERSLVFESLTEALAKQAHHSVMIVDDCSISLNCMKRIMEQLGLHLDGVPNALSALDLVDNAVAPEYLACFVDWHMPDLEGLETIKRLHAAFSTKGLTSPLMFLFTPYSQQELHTHNHEIDGLLTKPIDRRYVYQALAQSLGLSLNESSQTNRRQTTQMEWSRFTQLDILLVEDIDVNQEVIMALLASVGLQVRLSCNGLEALDSIAEKRPDLVLMDCQMPLMDGYEATQKLRERYNAETLPIIALTANALGEEVERCFAVGMNAHCAKPIRMAELYQQMFYCFPNSVVEQQPLPSKARQSESCDAPQFQGIDTAIGLANVGGRLPLLLRLLKMFNDNQGHNFEKQFTEAYALNDWTTLKRLTHSMKGVAQTFGASDLIESTNALLQSIDHQDQTRSQELFFEVANHLRFVIDGLSGLDQIIEASNADAGNAIISLTQLEQLAEMLQQHDTEAIDFASAITKNLTNSTVGTTWTNIEHAIEQFDFKIALTELEILIRQLKKNNEG